MSKPAPSGIPGVDAMTETFDFFKNMWSSVPGMNLPGLKNIPGIVMPTLSTDEIDKQITDLRAVESWLSLNLNMLQGTIQALEVQKATISTLQTMGETLTAAMQPLPKSDDVTSPFASPFTSSFSQPAKPAQPAKPTAKAEPKPAEPSPVEATPPAAEPVAAEAGGAAPALANPAAWWGMLQDQFKQAVNSATAMTPESAEPTAAVQSKPNAPAKKSAAAKTTGKKATPKT